MSYFFKSLLIRFKVLESRSFSLNLGSIKEYVFFNCFKVVIRKKEWMTFGEEMSILFFLKHVSAYKKVRKQ